ncbi:hypothetical protein GALL_551020 [mine drainage metagenome]|uniref:Uncharacterized protein n=1 Tax=mine drainage metagenome TaxID=410659 RepID=A0A1J5PIG7_9ZZZZ
MFKHIIFGIIPKIIRYNFIDACVAYDGKLTVYCGYINKHAVTQFGFVHIQLVEIFGSAVEHVLAAGLFDTNTQLPGSVPFGILYSGTDPLLFLVVKYGHIF